MRRIRYSAAMSLDGFIAGPNGEIDWITTSPEIDFRAIFAQFDTALIGRKTFDFMRNAGRTSMPGMKVLVFSTTLQQPDHPEVTVIGKDHREQLTALKRSQGKDIWLFGGGTLFRSLAEEGLVDTVEVSIMPTLLGAGTPVLSPPAMRQKLTLIAHKIYNSGIVSLEYKLD